MATIYDYETWKEPCFDDRFPTTIVAGLPGSSVSDEAWTEAKTIAENRGDPVVLDDDDGMWVIYSDGLRVKLSQVLLANFARTAKYLGWIEEGGTKSSIYDALEKYNNAYNALTKLIECLEQRTLNQRDA